MSSEIEIQMTDSPVMLTGLTIPMVSHGRQIYCKVEFSDGRLPGETFDDMSARITDAVTEHILRVLDEAVALTERKS